MIGTSVREMLNSWAQLSEKLPTITNDLNHYSTFRYVLPPVTKHPAYVAVAYQAIKRLTNTNIKYFIWYLYMYCYHNKLL